MWFLWGHFYPAKSLFRPYIKLPIRGGASFSGIMGKRAEQHPSEMICSDPPGIATFKLYLKVLINSYEERRDVGKCQAIRKPKCPRGHPLLTDSYSWAGKHSPSLGELSLQCKCSRVN